VVRLGEGTACDITHDGKLVLSNIPTDPAELVVYPTGAGQPRKLERGGLVSYETSVLFPDGKRVLTCGHEAGHAVRCYVQDIEGGKPRPLTPEGTTDGLVSPDGLLVLARDSGGGQKIYPVDGGPARPVPGATPDDAVVRWSADGKSLMIVSLWSDVPVKIERLDLATGRREPYRTLGPADMTGAIQISPIALSDDGKSYALTARRMASHLFLVQGAR
jgi:Tol biopolymer transport system component